MLLSIRDKVKGSKWLGNAIVIVIAIPFALWGVSSYLGGGSGVNAAQVNGEDVSVREFEQVYNQQRNQLRSIFGGNIPASMDGAALRQQALEVAITQNLLTQYSQQQGYGISDQQLSQAIMAFAPFHVDGVFNKARYEEQLRSSGTTEQGFEISMRRDMASDQLRSGIVASSFSLANEQSVKSRLLLQKRSGEYVRLQVEEVKAAIQIDDADIEAYYNDNSTQFRTDEQVKLSYIEFNTDLLKDEFQGSDEELRNYYEENRSNYVTPEQREASHILLAVDKDADTDSVEEKRKLALEILAKLKAGEAFAELAKTHSDDPGSAEQGGSVGRFQKGVMGDAFDEAAFALQAGEVSEPVRGDFGFHLIQLDAIVPEEGRSFDAVKAELADEYAKRQAENAYFERIDALANEVFENNTSLEAAAEAVGVEVKESQWLTREKGEGIGQYPAVRAAAFSADVLDNDLNSEILEIGANHVAAIRLKERQPSEVKPLADVKDDIMAMLRQLEAEKQLQASADQMLASMKGGQSLSAEATAKNLDVLPLKSVAREGAGELPVELISTLFRMPKPEAGAASFGQVRLANGDIAVMALTSIEEGAAEKAVDSALTASGGNSEYSAWVQSLRDSADIVRNPAIMELQ